MRFFALMIGRRVTKAAIPRSLFPRSQPHESLFIPGTGQQPEREKTALYESASYSSSVILPRGCFGITVAIFGGV